MSKESVAYEKFVQAIMQALLRAQGLETVTVQHNVVLGGGVSRDHQVDVYWEYRLGGVTHRVILNCKRYGRAVEGGDVYELSGVLRDYPDARGVIATTVGFQQGAIDHARKYGIGLKVIRPPTDADFGDSIRTVTVTGHMTIPEFRDVRIVFDGPWLRETFGEAAGGVDLKVAGSSTDVRVRDLNDGSTRTWSALFNEAVATNPTPAGSDGQGTIRWGNAMLDRPNGASLKVLEMTFCWHVRSLPDLVVTVKARDPAAIVQDAVAGTLLFVDDRGRVTGDVEAELGRKP